MDYANFDPYEQKDEPTKEIDPKEAKQEEKKFVKRVNKMAHQEEQYSSTEVKEREKLIGIILKYSTDDLCGDAVKKLPYELNKNGLKKYSTEKLKELLEEVRKAINGQSLSTVIETAYFGSISLLETASQKIPFIKEKCNLAGLGEAIQADPQIAIALRQISIENGCMDFMSPEQRLLLGTTFAVIKVVGMNRFLMARDLALQKHQATVEQTRKQTEEQENNEVPEVLVEVPA